MNEEIIKLMQKIRDADSYELPIPGMKLNPYPFQNKMIMNMYLSPSLVNGDSTGLGKTLESIGLMQYQKNKHGVDFNVVITVSSAGLQWCGEIERFSSFEPFFIRTLSTKRDTKLEGLENVGREGRIEQYNGWGSKYNVLVLHYPLLMKDGDFLIEKLFPLMYKKFDLYLDEATAFKTLEPLSKTHEVISKLVPFARRCHSLTATPMPNFLTEFFAIYAATRPSLFGSAAALARFKNEYCEYDMVDFWTTNKQGKKIKRVFYKLKGYKNLKDFKTKAWPFYYGRRKNEVELYLPELSQKVSWVDLNATESRVYRNLEDKLLETVDGLEEISAIQKLTYTQECVDSLELLPDSNKRDSSKLEELVRILKEEIPEEKVVVFSRFKKMINIIEKRLDSEGIRCLRITGDESSDQKDINRKLFTEDKNIPVILINTAGAKAMNLQVAGYLIVYDLLYSFGDMTQVIGRVHRIGSKNEKVLVIYLMVKNSIDEYVFEVLQTKQGFVEAVLDNVDVDTSEAVELKPSDIKQIIMERRK